MDEDNGACRWCNVLSNGIEINMPAVIVEQTIGISVDIIELRKKIEEGIRRTWKENPLAAIAKKVEEESVRLACARRKKYISRVYNNGTLCIQLSDRSAGAEKAAGVRLVTQP